MHLASAKRERIQKEKSKRQTRWVFIIFFLSIVLSFVISIVSSASLSRAGSLGAFCVVLILTFIGVLSDAVGVAVTAAKETPFASMASKKVRGAQQSVWLVRKAEKVSNVCNDVVGDITSIIAGSAGAVIAARVAFVGSEPWIGIAISAFIAGITVGGKAMGKQVAFLRCQEIVFFCGVALSFLPKKSWRSA